jgi:hypothetical protein
MYCSQIKVKKFEYQGSYPTYNNQANTNEMLYFYVSKDNSTNNHTMAYLEFDVYNPEFIDTHSINMTLDANK